MSLAPDPMRSLRPLREEEIDQLAAAQPSPDGGPLAYDVYRTGDELVIEFDVPGVPPAEIDVSVEGRMIVVGLRRGLVRGPGIDVIETGRQHGAFRQRLLAGDRWDLEGVTAHAEHGVLTVRTPLTAATLRRRVEVQEPTAAGVITDTSPAAPSRPEVDIAKAVHTAA
jgi:HSP20 family protein